MQRASWMLLVCVWFGLCAPGVAEERFVVDVEARSIAVRHEGVLHRRVGIEPILGRDDGDFGLLEVRDFLARIPGDEQLGIAQEEHPGRPPAARVRRVAE